MALDIDNDADFDGRRVNSNAAYPHGSAINDSTGTAGDGTPTLAKLWNDIFGLHQKLLDAAGITPTGSADTVEASQYFEALQALFTERSVALPFAIYEITDDAPSSVFTTSQLSEVADADNLLNASGQYELTQGDWDVFLQLPFRNGQLNLYDLEVSTNDGSSWSTYVTVGSENTGGDVDPGGTFLGRIRVTNDTTRVRLSAQGSYNSNIITGGQWFNIAQVRKA